MYIYIYIYIYHQFFDAASNSRCQLDNPRYFLASRFTVTVTAVPFPNCPIWPFQATLHSWLAPVLVSNLNHLCLRLSWFWCQRRLWNRFCLSEKLENLTFQVRLGKLYLELPIYGLSFHERYFLLKATPALETWNSNPNPEFFGRSMFRKPVLMKGNQNCLPIRIVCFWLEILLFFSPKSMGLPLEEDFEPKTLQI